jgi:hypothetical protein
MPLADLGWLRNNFYERLELLPDVQHDIWL